MAFARYVRALAESYHMGLPVPTLVPRPAPALWRCMCEGCGAPLQRHELQCSYCLRATAVQIDLLDVTTLDSPGRVFEVGTTGPEVFIPAKCAILKGPRDLR